jgi:hypothetical protein
MSLIPSSLQANTPNPTRSKLIHHLMIGVEEVGSILSTFPAEFDYGLCAKSKYNTKLHKTLYKFLFEVQIRFGDKGENLTFKNLVDGKTVSKAVIEFNRH